MTTHRVSWHIDVEADSPHDAARQAHEMVRRPDTAATVYEVDGETIDLLESTGHDASVYVEPRYSEQTNMADPSSLVAGQWQDIDSAPGDGTHILLGYLDQSGTFAVRSGYLMPDVHYGRTKHPCPAWVCTMDMRLLDPRATHWMSLPSPPRTLLGGSDAE